MSEKYLQRIIAGRLPYKGVITGLNPFDQALKLGQVEKAIGLSWDLFNRPISTSEISLAEKNRIDNLLIGMDEDCQDESNPFCPIHCPTNKAEEFFDINSNAKSLRF